LAAIGFIGGTGPEGKGLALRFAIAGHEVIIGSRSAERGEEAAHEIAALLPGGEVGGATNAQAAQGSDIVVVTVPYAGQKDTLASLEGDIGERLVVCTVVPLQFSRTRIAMLDVEAGSAAEEAQSLLPRAKVVAAFHNLSASHLLDAGQPVEGDVVVCGDDSEAVAEVISLAGQVERIRGLQGGPLANSRYVEALTALLLNINRIHKAETHVQIVGI
jgi:8-hydroxy-5-deazaflavin:NADPH oxidoreductase